MHRMRPLGTYIRTWKLGIHASSTAYKTISNKKTYVYTLKASHTCVRANGIHNGVLSIREFGASASAFRCVPRRFWVSCTVRLRIINLIARAAAEPNRQTCNIGSNAIHLVLIKIRADQLRCERVTHKVHTNAFPYSQYREPGSRQQ